MLVVFCSVLCFQGHAVDIFTSGAVWKYFKGTSEASQPDRTAWRMIDYDDSSWASGFTPFYYGESLKGTELSDMRNNYTCVFFRKSFNITNLSDISSLELNVLSDDGAIVWINGVEVAQFNMPEGDIPYNGVSLPALPEPIPWQSYTLKDPQRFLTNGLNIIAVQGFNCSLANSSDFVFDASLSYVIDTEPPLIISIDPEPGSVVRQINKIEVLFNEPVEGVDASDLLINGVPAEKLFISSQDDYIFEFATPSTGVVNIAWQPNHGIHDMSSRQNPFAGGSWIYYFDQNAPTGSVIISEFMADNKSTIRDEDGDYSDWIELRNIGDAPVNLKGWFLTDDSMNLTKWQFPEFVLDVKSYLLIFASGKNRTNSQGRLHTNFQLNKNGEYLALLDSKTNIIFEFSPQFPSQMTDVSYGCDRVNPSLKGYFEVPTPGLPNSNSGQGFAPDVEFSRPGGTFSQSFLLELSTKSTNAVIHYTLDGSLPTEASPVYSNGIVIYSFQKWMVRARAFEDKLFPGPLRSELYVPLAASTINFTSSLPVVVIYATNGIQSSSWKPSFIAIYEPINGVTSLTNKSVISTLSGVKYRGSSTLYQEKKNYALEFWDDFGDTKDLPVLGMPADSDWILYAPNNFDNVMLHNSLIFELSNQIGRYAPRTRYVELFVQTSTGALNYSSYQGIYILVEKIKRSSERVDIDKLEPEHSKPPEVTGGYILKIDRAGPGESGFYAGGQSICYVYPKESEINLPQRSAQKQYIQDYINQFGNVLAQPSFTNQFTGYAKFIDVNSWIDHHLLNILAFNVDALRLSAFFYKPRNGKLVFGPVWDFDRSMDSRDDNRDDNPRVWRAQTGDLGTDFFGFGTQAWWGRLFQDPDFWQRYIDRWQQLRVDKFSLTNIYKIIDLMAAQIKPALPREYAKWGYFTAPRNNSYQWEIDNLKRWLSNRVDFIDTNFLARPAFSHNGGRVDRGFQLQVFYKPGSTVYYTTDGSDPRLPGGGISPKAITLSGNTIQITSNVTITARAFDPLHKNLTGPNNPPISSSWSGLVSADFIVAPLPLIITELMYAPGPVKGNTNDPESFEFIEIKNAGTDPVNLNGVKFLAGIDFNFSNSVIRVLQPGERLLLVKNTNAFQSLYGTGLPIAGAYTGNLDNAGEHISLVGPQNEVICELVYDNKWYPITANHGFSLVLVDENTTSTNLSNPTLWRPSAHVYGSPGSADPTPDQILPVLVNEILAFPTNGLDLIELYNPNPVEINISGWFLTDNFDKYDKFVIPTNTVIGPNSYLVLDESIFGGTNGFSLKSSGEEIYLFSADVTGKLTGYYHGFKFGGSLPGLSYGRWVDSVGQEHFPILKKNTFGYTNAAPFQSPIVISEIMYNPGASANDTNTWFAGEFIELFNDSSSTVQFTDEFSTNTMKIDGGIKFSFPNGFVMKPFETVVLVNFDPKTDIANLNLFKSRYGLTNDITILGPVSGLLDNKGDKITLLMPLTTHPAEKTIWVPLDTVEYSNNYPWPTNVNGTGKSMHRISPFAYGSDPLNWKTASPTPGDYLDPAADNDDDGLPNWWEIRFGLNPFSADGDDGALGDPDHDNLPNISEFYAGTDPTNPNSTLKCFIDTPAQDTICIMFNAQPGVTYQLLSSSSLNGDWKQIGPDIVTNVSTMISIEATPTQDLQFYKVQIVK